MKSLIKQKIIDFMRDITSLGNPFIIILLVTISTKTKSEIYLMLLGLILIELLCFGIKLIYFKPRPDNKEYSSLFEKLSRGSFPSIHAARVTFIFFELALKRNDPMFFFMSLSIIALVSISRLTLKRHYYFDILFGILIGMGVLIIIHNI